VRDCVATRRDEHRGIAGQRLWRGRGRGKRASEAGDPTSKHDHVRSCFPFRSAIRSSPRSEHQPFSASLSSAGSSEPSVEKLTVCRLWPGSWPGSIRTSAQRTPPAEIISCLKAPLTTGAHHLSQGSPRWSRTPTAIGMGVKKIK
jgi:hypothetical protein